MRILLLSGLLLGELLLGAALPAHAQKTEYCEVRDPTGTELNARAAPGGLIIDKVPNGTQVYIRDAAVYKGKSWVDVYDADDEPIGWVFRDYLDCNVGMSEG